MKIFTEKGRGIDMTSGDIMPLMVRFSLPLMAGNLFQQLYSITDSFIIGRFAGVQAFGSIGTVYWFIWFLNAVSRDCSNAFCIAASVRIGRRDAEGFRRVVFHALAAGIAVSAAVCGLMLFFQRPLMTTIHVPEDSFESSFQYLRITILTLPAGIALCQASALLRAAGDSGTTFAAMTVSTVVNIALDILFVLVFRWGVPGAAAATWIAQACTAILAVRRLLGNPLFTLTKADCRLEAGLLQELAKLWLPLALNSLLLTLGGVSVQSRYNRLGTSFTAGYSASTKIFSIFEALIMAVQTGASVFVGQNLGAGQPGRIRSGVRKTVCAALLLSACIIGVCWSLDRRMIGAFLSRENSEAYHSACHVGVRFLHFQVTGMLIMAPMYIYRASVQTLGCGHYALIAAAAQMIVRITSLHVLPPLIGEYAYYMPTVLAWTVSLPVVGLPYAYHLRRLEKDAAR